MRTAIVGCFVALFVAVAGVTAGAEPYRTVSTPVRLVATGAVPTSVRGLNDYFGTLEVDAVSDGLVIVNKLPLEKYLLGLNEVPPDWPPEALKAQAIAARTYALWTLGRPPAGSADIYGFDICASTDCQVFTGADVLDAPDGQRWIEAVRATSGRVLVYREKPILARYHSVSGGHTLDNSEAFPGDPDLPYLRGVPSPTEEGSPLYRWRVTFQIDDLRAILERAGWWGAGALARVRTVPSRDQLHYPDVVLDGGGRRLVRSAQEFREVVGDIAPLMHPNRYPSAALTSTGRLPETFPSNRMTISTEDGIVRVEGRGWGHGVGMSQWGAYGLALEEAAAEDILRHYYSGAVLGEVASPGPLEVGVAWGRDHVEATGSFSLVDASGDALVDSAVGTWSLSWDGPGVVSVTAPAGIERPLKMRVVSAPEQIATGSPARIMLELSRPAEVVVTGGGRSFGPAIGAAGRDRLTWRAPATPGSYQVQVRADAGAGRRARAEITIDVVGAENPPRASGDPSGSGAAAIVGAVLGLALIAIGGAAFAGTMRR